METEKKATYLLPENTIYDLLLAAYNPRRFAAKCSKMIFNAEKLKKSMANLFPSMELPLEERVYDEEEYKGQSLLFLGNGSYYSS